MRGRILLPTLLLLSGFCGISYEILYTKLLGNLLGNQFTISASVLLTFLLGIGLGTLMAHRFVRLLWAVEAGIGVYAALMVVSYGWIDRLLYDGMPFLGTSLVACAAVSFVLLVVPAFLVGCSVPLFAAYLSTLRSTHVFSITYAIYNFGAAFTALAMEFVILRSFGLRAATLMLAGLNVLVAVALLALVRRTPIVPAPRIDRLWFAGRDLTALALASVASAIFQLLMIKIAECIFGPFNETFALVLATVLLGLALGAVATARLRLSFDVVLLLGLGGVCALLFTLPLAASQYAALYPSAVQSYPALVLLKLSLVFVMMGIPAIGFGATIPALLREHRNVAQESGQLLFVSSMANVAGFVLMAFVLHRVFDYGPLLLLVGLIAAVGLAVRAGLRRAPAWLALALLLFGFAGWKTTWSESLLYYGHGEFHSAQELAKARESEFTAEKFKGYQDIFAITHKNGNAYFFINGYISIMLSNVSEKLVGAISSMLAPRTDEALVLGIGSGATASTVGLIFDHTDAVDINKVVIDNLFRMKQYNFDIVNLPKLTIHHDDGIHFIKTSPKKYSLILNTVTSPQYFSSSKLYTRDFLDNVKGALAPDGIYTTWIDRKIGDKGVDIILGTLDDAFEDCWMTYIKSSYYLMVCSEEPVALRQLDTVIGTERLKDYLAREHNVAIGLLPYSILSVDVPRLMQRSDPPLNTLDFPVLEHEMARLQGQVRLLEFKDRLIERLDLEGVRRRLGPDFEWNPADFAFWADERLGSRTTLYEALGRVISQTYGDLSDEYAQSAADWTDAVGTGDSYYSVGKTLYDRDMYEAAIALFQKARQLLPRDHKPPYYEGRCQEKMGRSELARDAYRASLEIKSDDKRALEALRRVEDQSQR